MNQPIICAVSVSCGKKQDESTCSSILLDSKNGIVLTHASVLASHLTENSPLIKDLNKDVIWSRAQELNAFQVQILFPTSVSNKTSSHISKGNSHINLSYLNSDDQGSTPWTQFSGTARGVLRIRPLDTILQKLMPSDSWDFVEDLKPPDFKKDKKKTREEAFFYKLLPCFLLIKVDNWSSFNSHFSVKMSNDNYIGDSVEIVGTPFGCLNPDVFFNSRSRGVISNLAGRDKVLILTDTRCVPGSEGGALYYCDGNNRVLTGIMIATLCWKNSEWVGLSMACAMSHIVRTIQGLRLDLKLPNLMENVMSWTINSAVKRMTRLVPMVTVRGTWGSGVVLWQDDGQLTILTCGHVVKDAITSNVNVRFGGRRKMGASIVYRTSTYRQFDLAVLSCGGENREKTIPDIRFGTANEGDEVFVIGYGVFGEEHDLEPTVTSGIVSKVICVNKMPIMIQTSCAVHAGASGGPVINSQGEVVGIAVCNAKDVGSGASYPHVNMCVPMETISRVLQQYRDTKDTDVLRQLEVHSPVVHRLWSLESASTGSVPYLFSRL